MWIFLDQHCTQFRKKYRLPAHLSQYVACVGLEPTNPTMRSLLLKNTPHTDHTVSRSIVAEGRLKKSSSSPCHCPGTDLFITAVQDSTSCINIRNKLGAFYCSDVRFL